MGKRRPVPTGAGRDALLQADQAEALELRRRLGLLRGRRLRRLVVRRLHRDLPLRQDLKMRRAARCRPPAGGLAFGSSRLSPAPVGPNGTARREITSWDGTY